MSQDCMWVLGRGASIANGLTWVVPQEWKDDLIAKRVTRDDHIKKIVETLREEIARVPHEATPYLRLLDFMSTKTVARGRHTFITTNWDNLLQRDVLHWSKESGSDYAP